MKCLALAFIAFADISCTTVANRRDLYSPQPASDSYERQRQLAAKQTTVTAAMPAPEEGPPRPEFR